ncbi:MAG: hypothetical protein ACJ75F_10375 [Flavisolibacter sp.]|jgi:molybdopterin-guanine dinucleotide biosynthesis protein A
MTSRNLFLSRWSGACLAVTGGDSPLFNDQVVQRMTTARRQNAMAHVLEKLLKQNLTIDGLNSKYSKQFNHLQWPNIFLLQVVLLLH